MTHGAEITISGHAAEMAALRGITEEGIRAILMSTAAVIVPSGRDDPTVVIVVDTYAGKVWGVVFNFVTKNVITVRRARKDEVRQYEQEKQDRAYVL